MKIGFIGLGNVGMSLAGSLAKAGYKLTVTDLDRSKAESLLQLGATWADSPAETAIDADILITCLPSSNAVNAVLTGEKGAFSTLAPGSVWVEMGTNIGSEILRLAEIAKELGIETLEAPVTGGIHLVKSGDVTILCGGKLEISERVKPLMEVMGGEVLYIGELGKATAIKLVTNMLAFIHLVAAGEALMISKKSGIDLGVAFEAIRLSSGNSFVHETESQVILNGSYNIGFTIDLVQKDIGFVLENAKELGVPARLATLVSEIFEEGKNKYGGGAQSPQIVKLLEDELGEDLRAEGFPEELAAGPLYSVNLV